MTDKRPFTFLMRQSERSALKALAEKHDRSASALLRQWIRDAARELELTAPAGQSQARGGQNDLAN